MTLTNNVQTDESPVDFCKFSSWNKLISVVTMLFVFIRVALKHINYDAPSKARQFIIKKIQHECYSDEIKFLSSPSSKNIPVLVNQLNLFLDDNGILRSRGRINKTLYYDINVLNPILLPSNHHVTSLIIKDFHVRCKHLGLQTTINMIRTNGFWIPRARQVVKKTLSDCFICRKFNAFSFEYPKMTDMTKSQMNLVRPFLHTGVDYTGPLHVLENGSSKKMYILIYTCLNIRAVYLDLVPDMTTGTFLMSFIRFCNRFTIPTHLYSDNALSFIAGGNLLEKALTSQGFSDHLQQSNVKHIRTPTYSPWVASNWERLLRIVKGCLFKAVGRVKFTQFQLMTLLSDIENSINNRPLTYRSSDNDLDCISPNSFLKICNGSSLIFNDDSHDLYLPPSEKQKAMERSLDKRDEVFEHFKKDWYESYLLNLRKQSANLHQSNWTNRIKIGDVVLIKQPNKTRPFWLLGRILEVIMGDDGKIRSVLLLRGDGKKAHHSICHLYPMELSITHSGNSSAENSCNKKTSADETVRKPSTRAAAIKCRSHLQGME